MDGATALAYVRARYFDPKGDLGRVQRQQEFLGAVFDEAVSPATLLNPFRSCRARQRGTTALTVDERDGPIDLVRFALAMRAVAGGNGNRTRCRSPTSTTGPRRLRGPLGPRPCPRHLSTPSATTDPWR